MNSKLVIEELRKISNAHGGILRPEDVVEAASDSRSPLHSKFTWDDTKAGHQHRLWEARQVIRVVVEYQIVKGEKRQISVFQSIGNAQKRGYVETAVVLSNRKWREQLLHDALEDLQRFETRYQQLRELADVFKVSRSLKRKFNRRLAIAA
jgi:hypothetical protein